MERRERGVEEISANKLDFINSIQNADLGSKLKLFALITKEMELILSTYGDCMENLMLVDSEAEQLDKYFDEVNTYLPKDKKGLIGKMDDTITNILSMYDKYSYHRGYVEATKTNSSLELLLQIADKFKGVNKSVQAVEA